MANVSTLYATVTACSRCMSQIAPGSRTMTVTVSDEVWKAASIEVVKATAVLVFCATCSPLFDFSRLAVGRRKSEEDLIVECAAEDAEIESARSATSSALGISAQELTKEQIRGWLLEQQYLELASESLQLVPGAG